MPARLTISSADPAASPPGPIKSVLLTVLVIVLAGLALLVAIPLMVGVLIVGAGALAIARWRARRRTDAELTRGRENVRVIRRDP